MSEGYKALAKECDEVGECAQDKGKSALWLVWEGERDEVRKDIIHELVCWVKREVDVFGIDSTLESGHLESGRVCVRTVHSMHSPVVVLDESSAASVTSAWTKWSRLFARLASSS